MTYFMKYIKLFENFFEDEEWNRLAPYFLMKPSELKDLFHNEVKKEKPNLQLIKDLIDIQLVDINAEDDNAYTPLNWATYYDHVDLANLLLDNGADSKTYDKYVGNALHTAAERDSIQVATLLLDRGINKEAINFFKETPLHSASRNNSIQVATLLLDTGARIEKKNMNKRTPLHTAIGYNNIQIATLLLDRGANRNAEDIHNNTPWDLATYQTKQLLPQLKP